MEKKVTKKKKNQKKLKATIMMSLLCVVLMTGSTYAWFTLNNTANVNNMTLSVATMGSLKISDSAINNGEAGGSELSLSMADVMLYPATSKDGINIYKPVYTGNKITAYATPVAKELIEDTNKIGYYYEKTFYVRVEDTGEDAKYNLNLDSVNLSSQEGKDAQDAQNSLRISYTVGDTTKIVKNGTDSGTQSVTIDDTAKIGDSKWTGTAEAETLIDAASPTAVNLGKITANESTEVTMRIWVEGNDPDCVNDIVGGALKGSFQLSAAKVVE